MRLAISNLAWQLDEEAVVRHELALRGIQGVELAPTKVWERPVEVAPREAARYRRAWEDAGIRIVALQALLFGRPELTVFGTASQRAATREYLRGMIRLARDLGASVLVFGSPRNRAIGELPAATIAALATDFFRRVADDAWEAGVCLGLEPNPVAYACDFVTTAEEGLRWVERLRHPGFALHLDSGCMTLSGDPVADSIRRARGVLAHFHVSEPHLEEVGSGGVPHAAMAAALAASGYAGWTSIEMRAPRAGPSLPAVARALEVARACYGGATQA